MSSTAPTAPPYFGNDLDDYSGVAVSVILVLVVWTILSFLIRIQIKMQKKQKPGQDDYVCSAAMLVLIALTIVAYRSGVEGFGRRTAGMDEDQIHTVEKLQYVSYIMSLLSLCLSKISLVLFHRLLTPRQDQMRASEVLLGTIICWCIGSVVALAATSCPASPPWMLQGDICSRYRVAWIFITGFDVLTEASMFANSLWLIWSVQMGRQAKASITALFALRIAVVAATAIIHVVHLGPFVTAGDPLHIVVVPFVCFQAEVHLSMMTTNTTGLITWLRSFKGAWGTSGSQLENGYALSTLKSTGSRSQNKSAQRPTRDDTEHILAETPPREGGGVQSAIGTGQFPRSRSADSQSSQINMIRKTVEVKWES